MAARRLLIVMLVLLGISTLAAALVPTQNLDDKETSSTATVETQPPPRPKREPTGKGLGARITVGGEDIPVVKPVEVGDQLALTVACKCSDLVEIPGLSRIEAVAPGTPAHFDLLLTAAGSYGIRLTSADRVVARIEVEKAKSDGEAGGDPKD